MFIFFNLDSYLMILWEVKKNGYLIFFVKDNEVEIKMFKMIFCYDVDFFLEYVLVMVEEEVKIGIKLIYYILFYNDFYNLFLLIGCKIL